MCDFGPFPQGVYSAGRLDADSEGLLFLTNDAKVNYRLTNPKFEHKRMYAVQIEGMPTTEELTQLSNGVIIEGKQTKPALVRILNCEPKFPMHKGHIRQRKNIPTSWLEITLSEGRNRQVRKMTAAIGHPTLRLIRTSIVFLSLNDLLPGEFRNLSDVEVQQLQDLLLIV